MYRRNFRTLTVAAVAAIALVGGTSIPADAAMTSSRPSLASPLAAAPPKWALPYPITVDYKSLGHDSSISCRATDAVFGHQVKGQGLDRYEVLVVDGVKGTCGRLKAEQFKRLNPRKAVLLYESPNGDRPTALPGGTWPGYYLMMNRSAAMLPVIALQTLIPVVDPNRFSAGDMAVMYSPSPTDPYANGEVIKVTDVVGSSLVVTRDFFATGAVNYLAPPFIAALPTGPSYPGPEYNFSDLARLTPAAACRPDSCWRQLC